MKIRRKCHGKCLDLLGVSESFTETLYMIVTSYFICLRSLIPFTSCEYKNSTDTFWNNSIFIKNKIKYVLMWTAKKRYYSIYKHLCVRISLTRHSTAYVSEVFWTTIFFYIWYKIINICIALFFEIIISAVLHIHIK